jgi:hypothetical protein
MVSIRPEAAKCATKHGLKISSQCLAKAGIWIPPPDRNPLSNRLWYFASMVYVNRASGIVQAIVARKRPNGIWLNVKLPRLLNNPMVEKIIQKDVRSNPPKNTVIYEKVVSHL